MRVSTEDICFLLKVSLDPPTKGKAYPQRWGVELHNNLQTFCNSSSKSLRTKNVCLVLYNMCKIEECLWVIQCRTWLIEWLKSKLPWRWTEACSVCFWWLVEVRLISDVSMLTALFTGFVHHHRKLLRDIQTSVYLTSTVICHQTLLPVIVERPARRDALFRHVVIARGMLLRINVIRLCQVLNVLRVQAKARSTRVSRNTGVWQQLIIAGWSDSKTRHDRVRLCHYTHVKLYISITTSNTTDIPHTLYNNINYEIYLPPM